LGKLPRLRIAARVKPLKIRCLSEVFAAAQQREDLLQQVIFVMMTAATGMHHILEKCRE
jgi:hypothetical protein